VSDAGVQDEVALRANQRVGQVLKGKYRLDRVIGIGGMAVVYAATHRNQKRVAVKMLHLELSFASTIRARFLREGYVANTVDHPGALAVLDEDVAEDGAAFLVMELLEGKPLDAIAETMGHVLAENAVLSIGDQLTDVLAAAHAKAIVHRDIKPANLFVTGDGTLKVLDFGIARLRDAAAADATSTGVVLGTPAFMAPEQAYGRTAEVDGQSDVWATGATLFQLLAGRNVHGGGTASEILIKAATSPAVPVTTLRPDTHPRIAALVDRALAFDKAARWPSAAAMRDEIRAVVRDCFADVPSGKPALAALLEEAGGVSARAAPASFAATGMAGPPLTQPATPWHEQPTPAPPDRPGAFAPTLAVPIAPPAPAPPIAPVSPELATAAPLTRGAPPHPRTSPIASALVGVGAAIVVAAVVGWVLVAKGLLRPSSQAHAAASETAAVATTAPPASASAPAVTSVPSPSAPTAAPLATPEPSAAASAATASPPTAPSAAKVDAIPAAHSSPTPPAHAPAAARPARPAHLAKPSDDDLYHP
jgi:serine/threonine protein kinase